MTGAGVSTGRVVHTGQAIVDLVMEVAAVPAPGGDTFARRHDLAAGGGFNVMAAAARDGAEVRYAGAHGTGTFGDLVRAAMAAENIEVLSEPRAHQDTGFCVALVDDAAERTFVSTLGAEGDVSVDDYRAAQVRAGDVVYVTGYTLLHQASREALLGWLLELPGGVEVVVDPSPVVGEVPLDALRRVARSATVWSTNEREARILLARLGLGSPVGAAEQACALAQQLACSVVLRAGADGSTVVRLDTASGALATAEHVAAHPVRAVDTNGAGDAHCGVLCAGLAAGLDLGAAVRRATVAAGLAVARRGPATSPTRAEIDAAQG
jgi:sugar/nucleoside kinase (ribokinase family)